MWQSQIKHDLWKPFKNWLILKGEKCHITYYSICVTQRNIATHLNDMIQKKGYKMKWILTCTFCIKTIIKQAWDYSKNIIYIIHKNIFCDSNRFAQCFSLSGVNVFFYQTQTYECWNVFYLSEQYVNISLAAVLCAGETSACCCRQLRCRQFPKIESKLNLCHSQWPKSDSSV